MTHLAQPRPDYDGAVLRSAGWDDRKLIKQQRKRTIGVSNFWTPARGWKASSPHMAVSAGEPSDWEGGTYDYTRSSINGPIQVHIKRGAALVMARSDRPRSNLRLKPIGGADIDPVVSADGLTITYPGMWLGCDLIYKLGRKVKSWIKVWDKSIAPVRFGWTVRHHDSHTINIANNTLNLLDANGKIALTIPAPWGHDSSTAAPTHDGKQRIRCALNERARDGGAQTVWLKPNVDDMASAIGDVWLDPTVIVSGTTDVEDAGLLSAANADFNYGGWAVSPIGMVKNSTYVSNEVTRLATSALPTDTITGFRWVFYHYLASGAVTTAGTASAYRVTDGNVWTEGVNNGVAEVGASSWNDSAAPTAWLGGSNGCAISGTDYIADGSPPTHAFAAPGQGGAQTFALDPAWITYWASGGTNNGYITTVLSATDGQCFWPYTTEWSGNTPSWEIDYSAGPASGAIYYRRLQSRR